MTIRLVLVAWLAGALVLWGEPAVGAVAVDAATNSAAVTATSVTWSHTVAGVATALYVTCHVTTAETISGITYNTVAMTNIGEVLFLVDVTTTYVFRLVAPAAGANNVVASFSGSTGTKRCTAVSFSGVDQTTPEGTVVTAQSVGPDTGDAQDTTTVVSGMTFDTLTIKLTAANLAINAGQTSQALVSDGVTWNQVTSTKPATTTTTNTGETWDNANSHFQHLAVPIRPAASGVVLLLLE